MIHFIKVILIILSAVLLSKANEKHDKTLSIYWSFVTLYWFVNLLQGIL